VNNEMNLTNISSNCPVCYSWKHNTLWCRQ